MLKLLKSILFLLLLMLIAVPAEAQRWKILRYEASFGIGTCNIFGDIGGSATRNNLYGLKDITFSSTRPSLIFGARYKLQENMALKFNINFCMGGGTDAGSVNAERNYTYISFLSEQSLQYEFYFLTEDKIKRSGATYNRRGMVNNYSRIGFYGFAGLGGLFYTAKVTGTQPFPGIDTRLGPGYTLTLPVGLGLKYVYSDHWSFNAELGYHYTLSDGLDGLTSKYSKANDIYWMATVTACYRIKTNRNGYPEFLSRWFLPRPGRH